MYRAKECNMFQPGLLGAYPGGQNTRMVYRQNSGPLYDLNKNHYPNHFQNPTQHVPTSRYPQPHYQQPSQPNTGNQDTQSFNRKDWPPLNDGKSSANVSQNKTKQGYRDTDSPDANLSKEQQEERRQLYKLFYQVLRDNGPMDVCNQHILSTFMSLPESKRKIITTIGGIQRFFLKSPMFLIQGDIVCIAEENVNNDSSVATVSQPEEIFQRNNNQHESLNEQRQDSGKSNTQEIMHDKDGKANSPTKTPKAAGLDVQAQPFSPNSPTIESLESNYKCVDSVDCSRSQSESDADDILTELQTSFDEMQISYNKAHPLEKSAEDCHDEFTEKARLLGIDVRESRANQSESKQAPTSVSDGWRERRKSCEYRTLSPTMVQRDTKQIERRAQMKIKVKDMDLKKVNTELSEALNQITELTETNKKLQNRNSELLSKVEKLTNENSNLQEDMLKKDIELKENKCTKEMTVKLNETLARAREAEIKLLDNKYHQCLERIDNVVQNKESKCMSMFTPEDNISVDNLWKEYMELVDAQKADLKDQYHKIQESLNEDVLLKDCPVLFEQDISVFVKKGRKERLAQASAAVIEKHTVDKTSGLHKRPMLGSSITEKSPLKDQPALSTLRQPRKNPLQLFSEQPKAVPKPPGFSTVGVSLNQGQPLLKPRSSATSPPALQFKSAQSQVPVIRSPPYHSLENKPPPVFNSRLAPSFNYNFQYGAHDAQGRLPTPMPFMQIPAPAIPVINTSQMISYPPVQMPYSQYYSTTNTTLFSTTPTNNLKVYPMPVSHAQTLHSNEIPVASTKMALELEEGKPLQENQVKRKMQSNIESALIQNITDLNLGKSEVHVEDSEDQLEATCATFHVELDETECWDDEDFPSSSPKPSRGIGYKFGNPVESDNSLSMSDLVKTLQTWSQEIPSAFKLEGGDCDSNSKVSTEQNDKTAIVKVSYALSGGIQSTTPPIISAASLNPPGISTASLNPPGISTASLNPPGISAASLNPPGISTASLNPPGISTASLNPPGISTANLNPPSISTSVSPPSIPFIPSESRRWQEVTKKKKRKVQTAPIAVDEQKTQSSLEKIVYTLSLKMPQLERTDFIESIKVVRDFHKGTLSGVPLTEIVSKCINYLNDREKRKSMPQVDNTICAVCHEDLIDKDTINILECEHRFHDVCIKQWIHTRERTCPLCRKFILLPDDFPAL